MDGCGQILSFSSSPQFRDGSRKHGLKFGLRVTNAGSRGKEICPPQNACGGLEHTRGEQQRGG
ncbi:MAG TPA: hypothetical protein VMW38_05620, partial [Terriglobia bacterium]|nr:hypothetical protein [Terriglobia bacterium]